MKTVFSWKRFIALISFVFFLLGGFGTVWAKAQFKEGELLVKFKPGVTKEKKEKVHESMGAKKIKEFKGMSIHQLKLKGGMSVEEAMLEYSKKQGVEYAEPNYLLSTEQQPNDTYFDLLWGLHNTGQMSASSSGNDIDAPEAWDDYTGSDRLVVAVIDTGIDYSHEDLAANMWVNDLEKFGVAGVDDDNNGYVDDIYGIDAINNDTDPFDDNSHGTHVAGTIGAIGNNGIGVAGVNWNVQIMACKFLSAQGSGYTSDAIECLEYVRMMKNRGVPIVATNNSWGGGSYSMALYDAINTQSDILFVAAAGNSAVDNDLTPHYPSSYDLSSILAVAATDYNDNIAYFSCYGLQSVDIAAPGYYIASTIPYNGYAYKSGTSMATPHVTGLAALIKSVDESMTALEIKNLIMTSGDLLSASNQGYTQTDARINAANALSVLIPDPENLPPVANAGFDQTVEEGMSVLLDGTASMDLDDGIESYLWTQVEGVAVDVWALGPENATFTAPEVEQTEVLRFMLTVRDFSGMESSDTVVITIENIDLPNTPPVADAGEAQNLSDQDGSGSEQVLLDGLGSYDPDGTITSFVWKKGGLILGEGAQLAVELPVGTHLISLTVTDDLGESSTDTVNVTIAEAPVQEKIAIFVSDIAMSAKSKKGGRVWNAKAAVEVLDINGNPVGGAIVSGVWTDKVTQEVVGTTFSKGKRRNGKVFFTTPAQELGGTFTFTVTSITSDGKTYDPSQNNETSDSITVP